MNTDSFGYDLPNELIAQNPVSPRDECKLMVLDRERQNIDHLVFKEIEEVLTTGDVLVLNKSKVIPARIISTLNGKEVEILITRRVNDSDWMAMVRPGRLLREGAVVEINDKLSLEIVEILEDGQRLVRFSKTGEELDQIIRTVGQPPYPPYIKNTSANFEDYQTVYASEEGSIAAPTAGMHFTNELLDRLKKKGVEIAYVTLHVGLGTFLPIKSEKIEDHKMHTEFFNIDDNTTDILNKAKLDGRRIIAVGTTAVRVLESNFVDSKFVSGSGETDIFIYPGYQWRAVDALLTNFHLPKSTLILLTCSFGGKDFVFKAYEEAIKMKYRFYSFGDAMLIL